MEYLHRGFFFKEFEEFFSSEDIKSIHNSLVTIGVTKRFVCSSKVRVGIIKVRMMSIFMTGKPFSKRNTLSLTSENCHILFLLFLSFVPD